MVSKSWSFVRNFENFENFRKNYNFIKGGAPALRVIRAGTRLTVYRSLPYQNSIELGQSGAAHAGIFDEIFKKSCALLIVWIDYKQMLLLFANIRFFFCEVVPFFAGPSLASLAIVSVWQSCGKPSTKFPHGGLVECLSIPQLSCLSFLKNSKNSKILDIFLKILIFSKFLEIWNLMEPMFFITFSSFYHIHIDLRYTLDNESWALFTMSSSKTSITRQILALVYHFVRAQVCPA